MKTKIVLLISLSVMGAMIVFALVFPAALEKMMYKPGLYSHVLFAHVLAVTLFFSNAVIGMVWEARSLTSGRNEVILHTYETVSWLDAHFSSPMIILSVTAGIMLSFGMGGIWYTGWLSLSFLLFLFSGAVWVISDIPTQYRVKRLLAEVDPSAQALPAELLRLLKMRLWISLAGVVPLFVVFILMVYKPVIVPVAQWF
ncbi:MAG: DUF2269 family protein [Spirochaetales bacterium]|nr:DUF2269 family protein [Spirochaetales bacterium]